MKHVKMLGLLAVAAASMMAFASSASATATLTSPAGTTYKGTLHATLEKGTSALLKAGIEDTCTESTAHGTIVVNSEVNNNNTTHAQGALTGGTPPAGLTFSQCTKHTSTTKAGELTIKPNGEVFAINNVVHIVQTSAFGNITCNYGGGASPGTKIGTLSPGTPAKLVVNTTALPRQAGSDAFCAEKGTWTANYVVTTPGTLLLV